MKTLRLFRSLLAVFLTLVLTGCFQMEQVIRVKADGSGTISITAVMNAETLKQMLEMAKAAGEDAKSPLDEMMDETKAKEGAKKFGPGVKFEKMEKIKNASGEGAVVTYSFSDVTKLKVDFDLQDMGSGGGDGEAKEPLTFDFTKGSPAKLTIKATHKAPGEEKPVDDPDADAQLAMAAQMFKGAKITMAVVVDGTITETDAAHHDTSRITMAEMPFDEVMKDAKVFKALNKARSWEEACQVLKTVPGVKVEPKLTVKVQFK